MLNTFLAYIPYAVITTFTPGPNNLMCLYSVSTSGWSKGRYVVLGILAGFSCVMLVCILFCHQLAIYAPELVNWLKYIGAAYILWLAVHIAMSRPSESGGHSASFKGGFLLCISNVKVILFLITILTAYIIPSGAGFFEMLVHGIIIIAISVASWCLWGAVGGILQAFLTKHYRPFNIAMGVALLWCAWQILK